MTTDPGRCTTMQELRREIDGIDRELVRLLVRRAACIDRAAELKRAADLPARIPERVDEVIGNARAAAAAGGLDPTLASELWRRIVDWSIAREERALADGARSP
jgi:isochorismate pyruvate lyase